MTKNHAVFMLSSFRAFAIQYFHARSEHGKRCELCPDVQLERHCEIPCEALDTFLHCTRGDGRSAARRRGRRATLLIEAATKQWRGAGHPAVYQENNTDYLFLHAYSADNGRSRLHISTIEWENGWPRVARCRNTKI
jgi:hypothetical protein